MRDITLRHLPKTYDQEDGLSWLYPDEILLRRRPAETLPVGDAGSVEVDGVSEMCCDSRVECPRCVRQPAELLQRLAEIAEDLDGGRRIVDRGRERLYRDVGP